MTRQHDILIIGAGIIGCALARELARRGASVVVVESHEGVAEEASGASAGMLHYAPSRELPEAWHRLARRAHEEHRKLETALRDEVENPPRWNWGGCLYVATTPRAEKFIRENHETDRKAGFESHWLERAELKEREPALGRRVNAACYQPEQGWVDAAELTRALADSARAAGAEFRFTASVSDLFYKSGQAAGVEIDGDVLRAGDVIIAAGAWSGRFDPRGDWIIRPVRGQAVFLPCEAGPLVRHIVFGRGIYMVPRENGIILGATYEKVGFERDNTVGGITKILTSATTILPALNELSWKDVRIWNGFRPGTPDKVPIIGPDSEVDNLWWATGHLANGILLAPITARALADAICDDEAEEHSLFTTAVKAGE